MREFSIAAFKCGLAHVLWIMSGICSSCLIQVSPYKGYKTDLNNTNTSQPSEHVDTLYINLVASAVLNQDIYKPRSRHLLIKDLCMI